MGRWLATPACIAAAVSLAACTPGEKAPDTARVCYHMVPRKGGKYEYFEVARNVGDIEHCAAELEKMRLHFVALGGTHTEIAGAYQGQFIFVEREAISVSDSLSSSPYPILRRNGDGRLVTPNAPQ